MKFKAFYYFLMLLTITTFSFGQNKPNPVTPSANFIFKGRTEKISEKSVCLISPASSVTFSFKGMTANYTLKNIDAWDHHNYFCIEVDGEYKGRFKIEKGAAQSFSIKTAKNKNHLVTIYKATEAASGTILFDGSTVSNIIPTTLETKKENRINRRLNHLWGTE